MMMHEIFNLYELFAVYSEGLAFGAPTACNRQTKAGRVSPAMAAHKSGLNWDTTQNNEPKIL